MLRLRLPFRFKCRIRISWVLVVCQTSDMCICMLIPPIEPHRDVPWLGRALLSRDNVVTKIISQIRAQPGHRQHSPLLSWLEFVNENTNYK